MPAPHGTMKVAFDEIITTEVKRQHEPQRVVGDCVELQLTHGGEDLGTLHHPALLRRSQRAQSALGSCPSRSTSGVMIMAGDAGCRRRDRMLRMTSESGRPVEPPSMIDKAWPRRLENLPDRLVAELGMAVRLGPRVGLCPPCATMTSMRGFLHGRPPRAHRSASATTRFWRSRAKLLRTWTLAAVRFFLTRPDLIRLGDGYTTESDLHAKFWEFAAMTEGCRPPGPKAFKRMLQGLANTKPFGTTETSPNDSRAHRAPAGNFCGKS